MDKEQLRMELENLYQYESEEDERTFNSIEEDLQYCLQTGYAHMQTAYLLIAKIRQDKLYLFAKNDDGEYIHTWGEYVDRAKSRFNISRGWIFRNVKLYRIGMSLGFTDEELLNIEPLSLSLMTNLITIDRHNSLMIEKPEELGIIDGDTEEEINSKLRGFVTELNTLPPDQRVIRIKQDILKQEKIYFELGNDYVIYWWTSEHMDKQTLQSASPSVIEHLKKRIGDKSESNQVLEELDESE
jgi:hypothetical protein